MRNRSRRPSPPLPDSNDTLVKLFQPQTKAEWLRQQFSPGVALSLSPGSPWSSLHKPHGRIVRG